MCRRHRPQHVHPEPAARVRGLTDPRGPGPRPPGDRVPNSAARTGLALKAASPLPHICLVTMVNGAAKYMADSGSYDHVTYASMNSPYGKGAAEILAARVTELLALSGTGTEPLNEARATARPHPWPAGTGTRGISGVRPRST
ncbi:hypothetical protein ACIQU5_16920 [Streptomyces sp. NPDC090306]|uniref:hypothetical protein n=1 Tax=Streptomyces sp. NPDC090306 TaxID=3365961 RepID=UPI00381CAA04